MDAWILPLGILAVGFVVTRVAIMTVGSVQHLAHRKRQNELSIELLKQKIADTKRHQDLTAVAWNGYRMFVIDQIVEEADGICSFYLAPHDKKPLVGFRPGQYLTFRLSIPGREKPVVRCYSLSDSHRPDRYRVTIKRVAAPPDQPTAPPGLVSNFFHEQLEEGAILDVQAPRGHFVLNPETQRPAVFVAAGVGVTPLLCMAKTVAAEKSGREILFIYGVRSSNDHAFKEELEQLAEQHANIRLVVCYSRPTKRDEAGEGRDYHHDGRITVDIFRGYLQSTNYEFYLCGPPSMMEGLSTRLVKWGVAKKDIHSEAFGPATISKAFVQPEPKDTRKQPAGCQIKFSKSGKTLKWTGAAENLLDFALANGVSIESGCRAGNCGTCVVAIKSGRTAYLSEPGAEVEDGACLACIACPDGDVELDA